MPAVTISFNVPDDQMPRLVAALRLYWGQVPDGNGGSRDMTGPEILARVRLHTTAWLRKTVQQVEAEQASRTAVAAITPIEPG